VFRSTLYGYPRQGPNRELKKLVEQYWAGNAPPNELAPPITTASRTQPPTTP